MSLSSDLNTGQVVASAFASVNSSFVPRILYLLSLGLIDPNSGKSAA